MAKNQRARAPPRGRDRLVQDRTPPADMARASGSAIGNWREILVAWGVCARPWRPRRPFAWPERASAAAYPTLPRSPPPSPMPRLLRWMCPANRRLEPAHVQVSGRRTSARREKRARSERPDLRHARSGARGTGGEVSPDAPRGRRRGARGRRRKRTQMGAATCVRAAFELEPAKAAGDLCLRGRRRGLLQDLHKGNTREICTTARRSWRTRGRSWARISPRRSSLAVHGPRALPRQGRCGTRAGARAPPPLKARRIDERRARTRVVGPHEVV